MKLIKKAIKGYYGKRCPDFDPDCVVCQAWAEYDKLRKMKAYDKWMKITEKLPSYEHLYGRVK